MTNHRLPAPPRPKRITWAERLAQEGEFTKNDPPDPPGDRLTPAEIADRHPDQWVVLVKMERFEDRPGFRSAIVLGAHPDEREVLRMTHEIARRYHASAQYHTKHLRSKLFQP